MNAIKTGSKAHPIEYSLNHPCTITSPLFEFSLSLKVCCLENVWQDDLSKVKGQSKTYWQTHWHVLINVHIQTTNRERATGEINFKCNYENFQNWIFSWTHCTVYNNFSSIRVLFVCESLSSGKCLTIYLEDDLSKVKGQSNTYLLKTTGRELLMK